MIRRTSHEMIDRVNTAQDSMIAARLVRDPRVLRIARANLRRWMSHDGRRPRSVFQEWRFILDRLTAVEVANFLRSDTPMARRLRQSSPFAGVLSEAERRVIRQRHETARA